MSDNRLENVERFLMRKLSALEKRMERERKGNPPLSPVPTEQETLTNILTYVQDELRAPVLLESLESREKTLRERMHTRAYELNKMHQEDSSYLERSVVLDFETEFTNCNLFYEFAVHVQSPHNELTPKEVDGRLEMKYILERKVGNSHVGNVFKKILSGSDARYDFSRIIEDFNLTAKDFPVLREICNLRIAGKKSTEDMGDKTDSYGYRYVTDFFFTSQTFAELPEVMDNLCIDMLELETMQGEIKKIKRGMEERAK